MAVRTVYNRLLGAWFNVVGHHDTPLGGAYATEAEARAALDRPIDNRRGKNKMLAGKRKAAERRKAAQ